jgi:hypothetical protein
MYDAVKSSWFGTSKGYFFAFGNLSSYGLNFVLSTSPEWQASIKEVFRAGMESSNVLSISYGKPFQKDD